MSRTKGIKAVMAAGIGAAVLAGCLFAPLGASADDAMEEKQIRVGIFITVPNKYTLTTPAATLSSAGGLRIGVKQNGESALLDRISSGSDIRAMAEAYSALLGESSDFAAALAAFKAVKSAGGNPVLEAVERSAGKTYQVSEGTYATSAAASAAMAKWSQNATVKLIGGDSGLRGPLHLETGSFTSEAEAIAAAAQFSKAGADTFLALRPGGSGTEYSVMVGAAADSAALEALRIKLSGVAEAAVLKQAAPGGYLLKRQEFSVSQKAGSPTTLYQAPVGSFAVIQPGGNEPIKLAERYGRSYRGQFEIGSYNGALAVINEVDFEKYLYSVVGGEMPGSWHSEALKAQAVAARSYALSKGTAFGTAQVVDTTLSQVYNGTGSEKSTTIQAVDATAGTVMMYKGKPVEAVFSSSSGGQTADPSEVWGGSIPYLKSVSSPDHTSENGLMDWHRVLTPSGKTGYVRSDTVTLSESKNAAGAAIASVKSNDTNVRPIPLVQSDVSPVEKLSAGAKVTVLETVVQSNEMNWIRGPYTSQQLLDLMKGKTTNAVSGPIISLEVSQRGPSDRVQKLLVNGKELPVKTPDNLRGALGGLPSTRFWIEPAGELSLIGASGRTGTKGSGSQVQLLGANGVKTSSAGGASLNTIGAGGVIRPVAASSSWFIRGKGYGHGLGLSQYGAKGLAEQGYDYQAILKYYYKEIELVKDGY
ncbi:SpoIID/LytB domain-containing protein [Paenibacillus pasadenensis]|uniref:SpoIID/LytB domain-containing protein n=1 Tax=Paenibacillus pasadenensis TaxID=217090 RepID=UPI00203D0DAE|nr:SpoIID/LytB domain-containing protein [Paenibacillus pasadenensis]MCM3746690.1 SpoIID/LytB domain-containing protein [Paenibacillus pasadenensis]